MDSNPTRTWQAEEFRENKIAFDDVIGDPTAIPEPIDGNYNTVRRRSSIKVAKNDFDESHGTANPARPNVIDFVCDVDNVVSAVISNEDLLQRFYNVFVYGDDPKELSQKERTMLEQRMGRLFRKRKISPVTRYFTAIRKREN